MMFRFEFEAKVQKSPEIAKIARKNYQKYPFNSAESAII